MPGTHHPPNQPDEYFFKCTGIALDQYHPSCEIFYFWSFSIFGGTCAKYIVVEKTYFKNPNRSTCIDLFLTNSPCSFQELCQIYTGWSDFHEINITVLKSSFIKWRAMNLLQRL